LTVLLGLTTAIAWALANAFTQRAARIESSPVLVMFWVLVVSATAVVPVALLVDGLAGPWDPESLALPIAAGLLANLGFLLLLLALRRGNLSIVAPIIAVARP
jgi:drug/metabolite transporter (DMT)-like permease